MAEQTRPVNRLPVGSFDEHQFDVPPLRHRACYQKSRPSAFAPDLCDPPANASQRYLTRDVSQEISLYVHRKATLPDPHRHSLLFSHACDALHQVCVQGFACPRSLNINIRKCCIAGHFLFPAPHAQWTAPICLPSIKTRWANGIGRRSDCNDGRICLPYRSPRSGIYSFSEERQNE